MTAIFADTSANALDTLGQAFTFVSGKMSDMVTVILSNPIFLLPVGIFVCGAAIGLCSRLIGR